MKHSDTPARPSAAIDGDAFVHEQLGFIELHAGLARTYLEAGDNPGFRYALASMIARAKAVAGVVNDLSALAAEKEARS